MQATLEAGSPSYLRDLSPVPPRPVQWRRAGTALRALAKQEGDPLDATYTVVDALGGMAEERLFQRFRKNPEGRRLLAEHPDLPAMLDDHDRLCALPEGTLGRIYGDLCRSRGIRSGALVDSRRQMSRDYDQLDPTRQWFVDRLTVLHDLWHIITGYATQPRGEAAIVAFSFAQGLSYRPVPVFMVLSVIMRVARPRELWQAFRRGRQTSLLIAQRYEDLLALPLATVRARVRLPDGGLSHGSHPGIGLLA
jgi:ubiquinone biosynthesis protein COQ4